MNHLQMPYDKASSKDLLGHFMRYATNIKLKQHFLTAVYFVFGDCFEIRMDLSKRMCFFCRVCLKEMNNVKGLQEHSASGSHIKNVDIKEIEEKRNIVKYEKSFKRDTLHYKLQNAKMDLIGLHFIEGYESGMKTYFKCNLCGKHGKTEEMYNHITDTEHTDKYIRIRVAIRNYDISFETRQHLRKVISEKDGTSVEDIIMIKGSEFYPHVWEAGPSRVKNDFNRSDVENKIEKPTGNTKIDSKPSLKDCINENKHGMSYSQFTQILLKCNIIVKSHLDERTDLCSVPDLKLALNLLYYVLHIIYYYVQGSLNDADGTTRFDPLEEQYRIVSSCLGYLQKRLLPLYVKKNGSIKYK